jgi:murein DD-endopeptidase MepM/ murein hydrolase activator NlpD
MLGALTTFESSHGAIGTRQRPSQRLRKWEKPGLGLAINRGSLALASFAMVASPAARSLPPPVSPTCITSPFGPRVLANRPIAGTFHYGIDLRAPLGTAVRAITAGQIVGIDRRGAGGLEVRVQHPGFVALYAHLGSLAPALLQGRRKLNAGEKIAVVGYSGLTFGPHLYFELIIDGHRVDPAPYLIVSPCPR